MNRDEIKGKAQTLKGKSEQAIGRFADDPDLEDQGVSDEVAGKARDAFGRAKRKVGEAIEDVGTAIKKK